MKKILFVVVVSGLLIACKKDTANTIDNSQPIENTDSYTTDAQVNKKTPPLSQYITTITWRGARVWYTPTAAWVDSVTAVNFYSNGTVEWVKQGWEFVPRTPGTYSIQANTININFSYPPYTHSLQGSYDRTTGIISGTFTEERAPDATAPPVYSPGTTTGDFNFYKKN
ncbi:hypothetical protein CAP36_03135 [Chitinophagaceae bacterium IBVUCB2]|nr:hypothetical protein CAP36_03135 [Chitinophagaceae bacterium IBVUCB2]